MRPVTENDEMVWEDILEAEMENEIKQMPRRQPSTAVPDSAYRLEDIRSYVRPFVHRIDEAKAVVYQTEVRCRQGVGDSELTRARKAGQDHSQ